MKALALVLLTSAAVSAHHSFDAEFDRSKQVSLTGVVTKVEWTNPHVWFWVNVKDEATGIWAQGRKRRPSRGRREEARRLALESHRIGGGLC